VRGMPFARIESPLPGMLVSGMREKKNIANCEDCESFPCAPLVEFQKQAPHRAELFESAEYRKKSGIDAWLAKMRADYACPKCGNVNSPYYGKCRKCGENPGNDFIRRNGTLFSS